MLSFNRIGNLGRIANQMFQYASLKGIARSRKYDFCIPPRNVFGKFDPNVRNSNCCIYDLFNLESKNNIAITSNNIFQERMFDFDEELFNSCPDNVDLFGYFQTEKYFKHIEDEIRSDFTFSDDVISACKEAMNCFDTKVISLHVRRGDYKTNENHPLQTMEYYTKALSFLEKELPVIVFTDDIEWCHKTFSSDRFYVSESGDPITDLCTMTMCDYHIIANSSFSWWGSWLANSEKTIAPRNWFGDRLKLEKNTKDLYCPGWNII